jgi:hypothetical protein
VDLARVREELSGAADEVLARRVRGGLRIWTALATVGLPVAVAVQVWLARQALPAAG